MLSREDNELLTRVGPGTPCGESAAALLDAGLPGRRAHRRQAEEARAHAGRGSGAVPRRQGPARARRRAMRPSPRLALLRLRRGGRAALPLSRLEIRRRRQMHRAALRAGGHAAMQEACQRAYPVQQLAGILFAYIGPEAGAAAAALGNAGAQRRHARASSCCRCIAAIGCRRRRTRSIPCTPIYLHGHMLQDAAACTKRERAPITTGRSRITSSSSCTSRAWSGIRKVRIYGGEHAEREVGHPPSSPTSCSIRRASESRRIGACRWTTGIPTSSGVTSRRPDGATPAARRGDPRHLYAAPAEGGWRVRSHRFPTQDLMAWETQGPMFDRSRAAGPVRSRHRHVPQAAEAADRGGAAGKDPAGVVRDPELNEIISFTLSQGPGTDGPRARSGEISGTSSPREARMASELRVGVAGLALSRRKSCRAFAIFRACGSVPLRTRARRRATSS